MNFLAGLRDLQPVERLHRAVRLALRRAEGGEVMTSDEMRRALAHRLDVERDGDIPHAARVECRRSPAAEDAVEIAATDAAEPRVPVVRDRFDLQYRDGVGADQSV